MAAGLHLVVSATTAWLSVLLSGFLLPVIVHLARKCSRKHRRTFLAKKIWSVELMFINLSSLVGVTP